MDENSLGAAQERLLAWYRRLEQEAEEQRRREEAARQRTLAPATSEARPPEAAPPAGTPGVRPASTSSPATPPPHPETPPAPQAARPAGQAGATLDTAGVTVEAAPPAPAAGDEAARPRAAKKQRAPRPARSAPTVTDAAAAAHEVELDPSLLAHLPETVRRLLLEPEKETAQNYYATPFRETRAQLIRRLLDPPLTLEETARILNVCPMTVRRYTNRGILRHFRTAGDQRRFRLSDVLAFVESHGRPHDD